MDGKYFLDNILFLGVNPLTVVFYFPTAYKKKNGYYGEKENSKPNEGNLGKENSQSDKKNSRHESFPETTTVLVFLS